MASSRKLNEYAACDIRFDINVAQRSALNTSGSYEIMMEIRTAAGDDTASPPTDASSSTAHRFTFDAATLQQLHEELERVLQSFPKCYVYK